MRETRGEIYGVAGPTVVVKGMTGAVKNIYGVIPGLKATRGLATQLREGSAGAGGFRFGGIWTAVLLARPKLSNTIDIAMCKDTTITW